MKKYTGYRAADLAEPWAKFYHEQVPMLPLHVSEAVKKGPFAPSKLPPLARITELLEPNRTNFETGYTLEADGSIRVAVHTNMPGVSPEMWDWWFGWHGSHDSRYKLWHPKAHLAAAWADGRNEVAYIGRVSKIEEFIGKSLEKANIAFIAPTELGIPAAALADKSKAVFICARIGYTSWPIDFGWLVHQVRRTKEGAEMRSRFFMGGTHVQWRGRQVPAFFSKILQKMARLPERQAIDLLTHCSEEMNHLAGILPGLHHEFYQK